jgi:hypothetical protein
MAIQSIVYDIILIVHAIIEIIASLNCKHRYLPIDFTCYILTYIFFKFLSNSIKNQVQHKHK